MKRLFPLILITATLLWAGDDNRTTPANDQNLTQKHIKEQMEKEKKYAKEKTFYEGKDYNLSDKTVDPHELDKIPVIEPEDDFDMNDVYSDDQ
ncbi:hypothetical protein [Nitratifractor sp.]|uniref:hypothetical protein n=1 Tax=Nitratifractor sp. TaxID=2268144 RepID=UPI0025CF16B4|nr:hypothetical protein [Nitratifractor sp.]